MANRLMTMHYNTSLNARNVLHNYHKNRPLAEIENTYKIHIEDDPFDYKKIVKRPETRFSQFTIASNTKSDVVFAPDDELIKRIKSAPALRTSRKQQQQLNDAKSEVSTRVSIKSSSYVALSKKKRRLEQIKKRSQSATINSNNDSEVGQFLVLPMDEFGYRQRRKRLNQQIHEHWNQDSAQLSKSTKSQQNIDQWMPIVNENNTVDNTKQSNSLIDTFTNAATSDSEKVYHVSNEIGSLIAQKVDHGLKLVICRNGEPVKARKANSLNSSRDNNNTNRISELFDEMNVTPIMPLSWNDQIDKSGTTKILSPRKIEEKVVEKPVHERKLFVKKLMDEEEFRPKLRQELANRYQLTQNTKPKVNSSLLTSNSMQNLSQQPQTVAKVTSVEIIGVNTVVPKHLEPYFRPDVAPTSMPTLVAQQGNDVVFEENLSERQYNQIIENLTKQYLSNRRTNFILNTDTPLSQPPPAPTSTRTTTALAAPLPLPLPLPSNTTATMTNSSNNNVKLTFHDYGVSNELRKKQTNANVNRAHTNVLLNQARLNMFREQTKSRPNSPDLSINLQKKLLSKPTTAATAKPSHGGNSTSTNLQTLGSRQSTQNSITMRVNPFHNPISKAIKNAKQQKSTTNSSSKGGGGGDEPMFIRITTSLEPATKRNSIVTNNNRHQNDERNRSSLHNPSFTTFSETTAAVTSRLF